VIKGIVAPNLTFFTKEGKIDKEKCIWHMNWILSKGINGMFVTGTYGSGYLMSVEERIEMYELAKEVSKKYPESFVIAHTGCADTISSIRLTKAASEIGLDAVSAIGPYNYKYSEEEILGFYSALVNVSEIPVYAYNNPDVTGMPVSYKLAKKLEDVGIAGIKDSAINIQLLTSILNSNNINNNNFQYISGTTTGWLAFQKLGIDTMIAGMCNYAPEIVEALYRYSFSNSEKAVRAYQISYDLGSKIKIGNSVASSHISLKARGFEPGYTRLPLMVSYNDKKEKIAVISEYISEALDQISNL
jgi:dihydrodipicolinate synthase/N-acetylneuraminate lyase